MTDKPAMTIEEAAQNVINQMDLYLKGKLYLTTPKDIAVKALTEAYARGRRESLVNERYNLRMLADSISSTPSYTGDTSSDTDAVHIIVLSRINDINAMIDKTPES